jgi:cell division septal protein FtsQ
VRALISKTLRSAAVVAIVVLGFLIWARQSSLFVVQDLSLEGVSHVAPEEVLSLTHIKAGSNQLRIDLKEEASRLVSHPLVAEAEVRRTGFKGVTLRVKEELPVSVIGEKRRFGLSLEGRVLPFELCEGCSSLPALSIPLGSATPLQKLREPLALYTLNFYREFLKVSPLWAKRVSKIALLEGGDLLVSLEPREVKVNFGKGSFCEKIHRLTFILEENRYCLEGIKSIDLRVPDQVFVFPRGG